MRMNKSASETNEKPTAMLLNRLLQHVAMKKTVAVIHSTFIYHSESKQILAFLQSPVKELEIIFQK